MNAYLNAFERFASNTNAVIRAFALHAEQYAVGNENIALELHADGTYIVQEIFETHSGDIYLAFPQLEDDTDQSYRNALAMMWETLMAELPDLRNQLTAVRDLLTTALNDSIGTVAFPSIQAALDKLDKLLA